MREVTNSELSKRKEEFEKQIEEDRITGCKNNSRRLLDESLAYAKELQIRLIIQHLRLKGFKIIANEITREFLK